MNVRFIPELQWRDGYGITLGAIARICLLLYWRFRRTGWL